MSEESRWTNTQNSLTTKEDLHLYQRFSSVRHYLACAVNFFTGNVPITKQNSTVISRVYGMIWLNLDIALWSWTTHINLVNDCRMSVFVIVFLVLSRQVKEKYNRKCDYSFANTGLLWSPTDVSDRSWQSGNTCFSISTSCIYNLHIYFCSVYFWLRIFFPAIIINVLNIKSHV